MTTVLPGAPAAGGKIPTRALSLQRSQCQAHGPVTRCSARQVSLRRGIVRSPTAAVPAPAAEAAGSVGLSQRLTFARGQNFPEVKLASSSPEQLVP